MRDDGEDEIMAAAMKRSQDPEWNRRWFAEVLPHLMSAADAHWQSLTPEQRAEHMRRLEACWSRRTA